MICIELHSPISREPLCLKLVDAGRCRGILPKAEHARQHHCGRTAGGYPCVPRAVPRHCEFTKCEPLGCLGVTHQIDASTLLGCNCSAQISCYATMPLLHDNLCMQLRKNCGVSIPVPSRASEHPCCILMHGLAAWQLVRSYRFVEISSRYCHAMPALGPCSRRLFKH